MRRREFIALIGCVAVAWPLSVPAQQPEQVRRIGALINRAADDPQGEAGIAAFKQPLPVLLVVVSSRQEVRRHSFILIELLR